MGFWAEADRQAGREFGARFWRWFIAARVARTVWPVIAVGLAAGLVVLAWRLIASMIGSHKPSSQVVWVVGAVAVLAALALIVYAAVQQMTGPPRRRRRYR